MRRLSSEKSVPKLVHKPAFYHYSVKYEDVHDYQYAKIFSLQATVAAIEATANTEEEDIETPNVDLEAGDEAKILWSINYDRFKQEFRDQVIVQAVTRRIDASAGALIRQGLLLATGRCSSNV